jgi:hypothetical protein
VVDLTGWDSLARHHYGPPRRHGVDWPGAQTIAGRILKGAVFGSQSTAGMM